VTNQSVSYIDLNLILKPKMLSKDVEKKPSGAEYRKSRTEREHEFEVC
jgi:hypothetical protein